MKNKIFGGLEVKKVSQEDIPVLPEYLVDSWGLVDKGTGKWMPKCFSRKTEHIQDMYKDINSILSSPVEEIIHLSSFSWGWDHDNYVPSMALNLWLSINPGIIDQMRLTLDEYQKNRAIKDKKKLKKAKLAAKAAKLEGKTTPGVRGRPKKNSGGSSISMSSPSISRASGVKRGRGRPKKNPLESTAAPGNILEKRGRGRPKKTV